MTPLQILIQRTVYNLQQTIKYAEENKLINTQEFLDFLDKINELSVSY